MRNSLFELPYPERVIGLCAEGDLLFMVARELLEILVCPETKQKVRLAEEELIARLNEKIDRGEIKTRDGEVVSERLDAGLIREDGVVLYPVRSDIPVMLLDEAIELQAQSL